MSRIFFTPKPVKSARKGWGISVTHSSQCLYIMSSMMRALALGRSGYTSCAVRPYFTVEISSTLVPSGEIRKPPTPLGMRVTTWRLLPSAFITHIWGLPSCGATKATRFPPSIQTASPSDAGVVVRRFTFDPSVSITYSSLLDLFCSTLS